MGQKIAQTYNRMKNESVEFFIISDGDFLKGAFAEGFEKISDPPDFASARFKAVYGGL